MGKRKSAKKPFKGRKQLKVAKVFDCPYCGNKDSVKCYIDKKDAMMATLACERVCAIFARVEGAGGEESGGRGQCPRALTGHALTHSLTHARARTV